MRAHSRCFGLHAISGLIAGMAAFSCVLARGEFAHVINSPPDVIGDYETIGSNTQVNLYPGATTPRDLQLGPTWYSADNIEFNLLGGTFGSEDYPFGGLSTSGRWARNTNVAVNVVSGKLWGDLEANGQALVRMSGGTITGRLFAAEGTLAAVAGGEILGGLSASQGSLVQLSGGEVGRGYWYWNEGVFITGAPCSR